MIDLVMTAHAERRFAQRGFRRETVETLVAFGRRERSNGADVYFMDRKARSRAREALGAKRYAKVEDRLDAYVVVADDGAIVTIAKRLRRRRG